MAEHQQRQRNTPTKSALAREVRRQRQGTRKRRRRIFFTAIASFFALALIVSLIIPSFPFQNRGADTPVSQGPGLRLTDLGNEHIYPGESHPSYNSIPPTSGWHYEKQMAPWGTHEVQIADEVYLHNLEYGGVAIQYATDDEELIAQLENFAELQPGFPSCFIVAPYSPMAASIALTAWGVIEYFETFDLQGIQEFVDAYRNKGPEQITDIDCG